MLIKIKNPFLFNLILKTQLVSDLFNENIDTNMIDGEFLKNYFNKHLEKIKNECLNEHSYKYDYPEEAIDITSPFFDELAENGMLEDFSIIIPIDGKFDLKLKNDYSSVFDKLNESKYKYSSITVNICNDFNLKNLNQFKINFKQIKRLTIKMKEDKISGLALKNIINNKYLFRFRTKFSIFKFNK